MKTLVDVVQERTAELESRWVALVLVRYREHLLIEEGRIVDLHRARERVARPRNWFEVLGSGGFEKITAEEPIMHGGEKAVLYLIVSREPFVLMTYDGQGMGDVDRSNYRIVRSQQVNRGKLGQFPDVPLPIFTRGAKGRRWVRLTELAQFLSHTLEEVWSACHDIGRSTTGESFIEICIDGCGTDRQVVSVNVLREPQPGGQDDPYAFERIWVPSDWASDVCYLVHFGRLHNAKQAVRREPCTWLEHVDSEPW